MPSVVDEAVRSPLPVNLRRPWSCLISSSQNPRFKRWVCLLGSRGINRFQQCLVFGETVIREVLTQHHSCCLELLCPSGKTFSLPKPDHVPIFYLAQPLFQQLDLFGTRYPMLVCQVPVLPHVDLIQSPQGLELLCPLGDPANVGAFIRTAVAMGVSRVVFLQEAAHPFHPKSVRATSGTIFKQRLVRGPSLSALACVPNIVRLDKNGHPLPKFDWPKHIRVLVGEEGQGLPLLPYQKVVAIPIIKTIDSLNAVVAMGMALYSYRMQHPLKGYLNTDTQLRVTGEDTKGRPPWR